MSLFKKMQSRQLQRKANNFIKSLSKKSEKEIEQAYLDNKEFENDEIVLSFLFFKHPNLIRILPIDFQVSRINSNLTMFKYSSKEARKEIVLSWLKSNKFFMNANVVKFTDEEYSEYIRLYFQQPKDVSKLFMEDIRKVISILSEIDLKETENIVTTIKDDLTDRQWEFVIEATPMFIKYAPSNVQNKFSDDEKYNLYIKGQARKDFIEKQVEKVKEDISLLNTMPVDVQADYINKYPFMINSIDDKTLIELLKYDINLVKYINMPILRNEKDRSQEVIYGILDNIESKSTKEIINLFINKGLVNAKGKLYRFDAKSNDISFQYSKKLITVIQKLDINQIISLIMIDSNYILPYICPVYNENDEKSEKEKVVIDCNSRCLNVFKVYYDENIYEDYYKVINKIFNDYLANIDAHDYEKDYNCILDLFKVLFNKNIITKNNVQKVTMFIGMTLLYKESTKPGTKEITVKLLNELLSTAYGKEINNDKELYDLNTLEVFDNRLSLIPQDLLFDYVKYNFVNISSLLFVAKANKANTLFKKYYEIICEIYYKNKESLFKAVENFQYYIDILKDVENKELSDLEQENLVELLASYRNECNITKKEELEKYDITLLRKLISELSIAKDENVYRNLLCNYLFNKAYDQSGNPGLLENDTIKEICDIYSPETLSDLTINGEKVFTTDEENLFTMTSLMFNIKDFDLLLSYIEDFLNKKVKRNIVNAINLFNKFKKYRIELINSQIVSLSEIKLLYNQKKDIVSYENKDGVEIYTIINQDFKVLSSSNNDGIHYLCDNVSNFQKNSYGFDKMLRDGSIRFTTYEDRTLIKVNKDNKDKTINKPSFIICVKDVTSELIEIAKNNDLAIVRVERKLDI